MKMVRKSLSIQLVVKKNYIKEAYLSLPLSYFEVFVAAESF